MRIALFGAAPDTPNMGVSALFASAITGLSRYLDPVEFVVFDNGIGRRNELFSGPDGKNIQLIRFGARGGRRYHRPENLATMLLTSRLGRMGAILNEGIRLIDSCTAVLDVSGGDSFSDIYGRARFNNIFRPKAIAINRGKPLILLPQTYGPYKSPEVATLASSVVSKASMAWARDQHSFGNLKQLLGDCFRPAIHQCGVDMAFGLMAIPASHLLDEHLNEWLAGKTKTQALIGFNVSGLIYNDPAAAIESYGLKADYRQTVTGFLQRILDATSARVLLISHVMDQPGHFESDLAACRNVAMRLGEKYKNRVAVAPATLNESQVKWLIAQMDWFCGTRMHSTIAGLSSGIPTAAVSYSDKTAGVFETCKQARQVMDPRILTTADVINGLWESFSTRDELRRSLSASLPRVIESVTSQFRVIAEHINGGNSPVAGVDR
ncbi:MAG: polysaccharide pyruvyl transferase family protein [Georgfuchsia sp.]